MKRSSTSPAQSFEVTMENANSQLMAASERIRETAKWLILSLAGIGGILVAGMQLSSIGSLDATSDRFGKIILAGILAAFGAALVLGAAVWTATTKAVQLSRLKARDKRLQDVTLLQGFGSVATLRSKYATALKGRQQALQENYANPTQLTSTKATSANAEVEALDGIVRNVLAVASYNKLVRTWRISSAVIAVGATLAGSGIALFAWAANPPESEKATIGSPGLLTQPINGSMDLTQQGQEALRKNLGDNCPVAEQMDVYVVGQTDAGPDVIVLQDSCNPIRLILGTDWGAVQTP